MKFALSNIRNLSVFSPLIISIMIISLSGCGGGGGENSSATGISPYEVEIQTAIDQFSSSITRKSRTDVMSQIDSNLKYYQQDSSSPTGFTLKGYNDFNQNLVVFFNNYASISFKIQNLAIQGNGSVSTVRGNLSCHYANSKESKQINETIELRMEKFSVWGITELYKYDQHLGIAGTAFPPAN